jgi:ribonuclease Y
MAEVFLPVYAAALGMTDSAAILIIAVLLAAGVTLGYVARSLIGKIQSSEDEKLIRSKMADLETELKSRRERAEIDARMKVLEAQENFERFVTQRKADMKAAEEARLSELAGMTFSEAKKEMYRLIEEDIKADADSLSLKIQNEAKETAEKKAASIVVEAIQRCAVAQVNEESTATLMLQDKRVKGRIVGKEGRNAKAFEQYAGVTLMLEESDDVVVISSFDPMRREIAKRALTSLVADGRIHPDSIEKTLERVRSKMADELRDLGKSAASECGVTGLGGEVLRVLGELNFRTSYTQNVLRHSVETSLLSGVIASELGLDEALARRIGLLHDVGKAMSSAKTGSHAIVGAEFLKAQGEAQAVCEAVASHHREAGSDGGIYGTLCAAADAVSSARPGARKENARDYIERSGSIEKIAMRFNGVKSAYAVQSGRDLRVFVDPNSVSDQAASEIAREICRQITSEVKFPGVVKVTVIRESRTIEYAK